MDLTALKTELTTDPRTYGYVADIASGDMGALAAKLNLVRESITLRRPNGKVPKDQLLVWATGCGLVSKLRDIEDDTNYPHSLRSAAIAFRMMIPLNTTENFEVDANAAFVAGCVAVNLITQEQSDALSELADYEGSRADELGLGSVTWENCAAALAS